MIGGKDFGGKKDHQETKDQSKNREGEEETKHHRNRRRLIQRETLKHGNHPNSHWNHG